MISRNLQCSRRSVCVAALLPPIPGLLLVLLTGEAWDRRQAFTDVGQANRPYRVAAFAELVDFAALVVLALATAWLLLALAAALALECASVDLRGSSRLAVRVAPRQVRTLVRVACGLAAVAAVGPPTHASGTSLPVPDRPRTSQEAPVLTPTGRLDGVDHMQATVEKRHVSTLLVRRGDTLWSIAEEHLPEHATDADVARAWPMWFQRNADVLGDDPDLILTGTQLTVPDTFIDTTTKGP